MLTKSLNKTIAAFLGDSITMGYALEQPEQQRYARRICDRYGLVERNFGITGTLMAEAGMNGGDKSHQSFHQRLRSPEVYTSDLLVIFGGTNDYFWTDTPIYPPAEMQNPGAAYFASAIEAMCQFILGNRDPSTTLFVTPYPHKGIGNYEGGATYDASNTHETSQKNFVGHTIRDYSDCLVKTCRKYGIPVLNLQEVDGFDYTTMTIDGCHPNPEGHAWLADVIGNRIAEMLENKDL